jgi:hypothetical protein
MVSPVVQLEYCIMARAHVHVQLLVAMQERQSWLRRRQVDLDLLPGGNDDDVLSNAGTRCAGNANNVECVPMKMDWMRMRTLIVEHPAIAVVRFDLDGIGARMRFAVDGSAMPVVRRSKDER